MQSFATYTIDVETPDGLCHYDWEAEFSLEWSNDQDTGVNCRAEFYRAVLTDLACDRDILVKLARETQVQEIETRASEYFATNWREFQEAA